MVPMAFHPSSPRKIKMHLATRNSYSTFTMGRLNLSGHTREVTETCHWRAEEIQSASGLLHKQGHPSKKKKKDQLALFYNSYSNHIMDGHTGERESYCLLSYAVFRERTRTPNVGGLPTKRNIAFWNQGKDLGYCQDYEEQSSVHNPGINIPVLESNAMPMILHTKKGNNGVQERGAQLAH